MVLVRRYSGVENQRTTKGRSYPGFGNVKDGRTKKSTVPCNIDFVHRASDGNFTNVINFLITIICARR